MPTSAILVLSADRVLSLVVLKVNIVVVVTQGRLLHVGRANPGGCPEDTSIWRPLLSHVGLRRAGDMPAAAHGPSGGHLLLDAPCPPQPLPLHPLPLAPPRPLHHRSQRRCTFNHHLNSFTSHADHSRTV